MWLSTIKPDDYINYKCKWYYGLASYTVDEYVIFMSSAQINAEKIYFTYCGNDGKAFEDIFGRKASHRKAGVAEYNENLLNGIDPAVVHSYNANNCILCTDFL